jgi:pyridoxamine 5'-phosphate oxidase
VNHRIDSIRQDYTLATLNEEDIHPHPFTQFNHWFQQALNAEISEVNAMTLSTVDEACNPHARIVLLKGLEDDKFVFFTNYSSHKGQQIATNPKASLLFFWKELQRQVRVEGVLEKISEEASTAYFQSRPRESQIGAWASHQSEILNSRQILEDRFQSISKQYEEQDIPKPPHWGGYALVANKLEFWQGRASRLHDRLVYSLEQGKWAISRLNP